MLVVALVLGTCAPVALAKTHKDNYLVSCDQLWRAIKDTLRNSGKYGIIAIDNNELTASYNIGGSLTGKRINSVVLNRLGADKCEMQTQTAFSGLVNNDASDFKKRVDESLARLPKDAPPEPGKAAPELAGTQTLTSPEFKIGQTLEEVEKLGGKPVDTVKLKDTLVYIYPTCKLVIENGKVSEIQPR